MNKTASKKTKVIIYGGNGFVGTHVAEHLSRCDADVLALSRTGDKPAHLQNQRWSEHVKWCRGDASQPDMNILATADSVVCTVGSPPIPTIGQAAWDHQFFMNGTTNINALDAAAEIGVKRAVLVGAKIAFAFKTDRFAYFKGKRLAREAAVRFADRSSEQSAIVIEPGVIYGKRHLRSGTAIPLGMFSPLALLMPGYFMDVNRLAKRIAHEALNFDAQQPFTRVENQDI